MSYETYAVECKTALESMQMTAAEIIEANNVATIAVETIVDRMIITAKSPDEFKRLMRGTGFIMLKLIEAAMEMTEQETKQKGGQS